MTTHRTTYTAADALTYLAALVRSTVESVAESIPEAELHQLHALVDTASDLCADRGSHDYYSTGRPVWSQARLSNGHLYSHLWHPAKNTPRIIEFPPSSGARERLYVLPSFGLVIAPDGDDAA